MMFTTGTSNKRHHHPEKHALVTMTQYGTNITRNEIAKRTKKKLRISGETIASIG